MIEPIKEAGMQDYRLDAIERPERHPAAIDASRVEALARWLTIRAVNCPAARSMDADSDWPSGRSRATTGNRTAVRTLPQEIAKE